MSYFDVFKKRQRPEVPPIEPARIILPNGADAYAEKAFQEEVESVANAPVGTRNDTLNRAAFSLFTLAAAGRLNPARVAEALTQAARSAGLEEREIRATINSAYRAGITQPRQVPDLSPTPTPTVLEADPAELRQLQLEAEIERERRRREAKRIVDDEEAAATFRPPPYRPTLTEELAIPDEPIEYTIDRLLPAGGNVLLTAQYKTGKTTLINALAKSLADQEPFLGRFDVAKLDGRVALFNYELDERQYRRWLRDLGIRNTDQVVVLNLRGYRLPITSRHVEDWLVDWLIDRDVRFWVVDPFARAFVGCGTSENDNTEVGRFLDTLDVIKARAGVSELVLPTHTGRAEFEPGAERARGATRLDDWADVRWLLTKDDEDVRYFRATGRDVEVDEEALSYDQTSRTLKLGGWDRKTAGRRRVEEQVLEAIRESPGCSQRDICDRVGIHHSKVKAALDGLISANKVLAKRSQRRGKADAYYLVGVTVIE